MSENKGVKKNKYWVGVLYTENMISDWQIELGDLVQLPYAYCIHNDVDEKGEDRKEHVHLILAWSNPTTYKHAMSVFDRLSAPNKKALNTIEDVINIRNMYEYLIHNTETCKKKNKRLYPKEARITGNNFDIGGFEQLSAKEKNDMCSELAKLICDNCYTNFMDFYMDVITNFDSNYFEILKTYSGFFERLTKANFQRVSKYNSVKRD